MISKIINLFTWLFLASTVAAQNEPYQGGSADGYGRMELVTPFTFPTSFQPYIGGLAGGQIKAEVINAVFPFPSHFYVFAGGANDGWTGNLVPGVTILPLTLFQFRGEATGLYNQLYWTTENEVNTAHFEIERGSNGQQFEAFARKEGRGYYTGRTQYMLTDSVPLKGKNYYRIRMVDRDGSFKYSPVIVLDRNNSFGGLVLFPNPVRHQLQLRFADAPKGEVNWTITDVQGRKVVQQRILNSSAIYGINIAHLPAGAYWLQVEAEGALQVIQFAKQ